MTNKEIDDHKGILRNLLNGYGVDMQNSITVALTLLDKQYPRNVISIDGVSSQACPICRKNVNNNYCPSCGQRIKYSN